MSSRASRCTTGTSVRKTRLVARSSPAPSFASIDPLDRGLLHSPFHHAPSVPGQAHRRPAWRRGRRCVVTMPTASACDLAGSVFRLEARPRGLVGRDLILKQGGGDVVQPLEQPVRGVVVDREGVDIVAGRDGAARQNRRSPPRPGSHIVSPQLHRLPRWSDRRWPAAAPTCRSCRGRCHRSASR